MDAAVQEETSRAPRKVHFYIASISNGIPRWELNHPGSELKGENVSWGSNPGKQKGNEQKCLADPCFCWARFYYNSFSSSVQISSNGPQSEGSNFKALNVLVPDDLRLPLAFLLLAVRLAALFSIAIPLIRIHFANFLVILLLHISKMLAGMDGRYRWSQVYNPQGVQREDKIQLQQLLISTGLRTRARHWPSWL